ncbi:YaiI/YqxD family protein [Faecalimonas canis]
MKIFVDADACPVINIIEKVAEEYGIEVTLFCDTNHILHSEYSKIKVIGAGTDAVDFALVNSCQKGDIVITQDYGVAVMTLGRGAYAIHQSGKWYTDENIDGLLMQRHLVKKVRRTSSKHHLKGQRKRNKEDDIIFEKSFLQLIEKVKQGE